MSTLTIQNFDLIALIGLVYGTIKCASYVYVKMLKLEEKRRQYDEENIRRLIPPPVTNIQACNVQTSNVQSNNVPPSNVPPNNVPPSNVPPSNVQMDNIPSLPSNIFSAAPARTSIDQRCSSISSATNSSAASVGHSSVGHSSVMHPPISMITPTLLPQMISRPSLLSLTCPEFESTPLNKSPSMPSMSLSSFAQTSPTRPSSPANVNDPDRYQMTSGLYNLSPTWIDQGHDEDIEIAQTK